LAYGFSLGLYLLSILAKVSSVIFPLLLILYDISFTARSRKEWIKDKIPFFLMSAFFSGMAVYIYHLQKIIPAYHGGHPINNFLTMANVVVEYILSLFVPLYLNFYYDTRLVQSFGEYQLLLSLSFLLLLAILAVGWYRKERPLFFSLLWFFIPLLPVLNIVPIAILRADRYLYLPSVGFAYFLAWGIPRVLGDTGRKGPGVALGVLLLVVGVFGWITEKQAGYWRSPFDLWTQVMKYVPGEARAYRSLGNEARDRGKLDLAILYFQGALQRSPKDESVMNNLGDVYLMKGQMEKAREFFEQALKQNPKYPDALVNMGIVYSKMGQDSLAIEAFEKAKKDKKNRATAANNLGVIFQKQGNLPEAIAAFREATQADPAFVLAHNNLAMALRRDGKIEEAIAQLHRALPVQPRNFQTQFNLGRFYLEKKEPHRAAGYLIEALKSRPENAEAHFHLALALRLLPQHRETARFHFEEAMKNERDPQARKEMQEKWKGSGRESSRAGGPAPSLRERGTT
jgi:tetratricopeptide (TPR) repeat protein